MKLQVVLLSVSLLVLHVLAQRFDKPDDGCPSYLCCAAEAQSPLITAAYPLHRAVAYFDMPAVKAAIAAGANVNQRVPFSSRPDANVYSPLRVALESTTHIGHGSRTLPDPAIHISMYLLCAGANPNEIISDNYRGAHTLIFAAVRPPAQYSLVYALLLSGAKADTVSTGEYFSTTLHFAGCNVVMTALLLAFGANREAKDSQGNTALEAVLHDHTPGGWQPGAPRNCDKVVDKCRARCLLLQQGLTPSETAELRAGRVSPALAAKLDHHPNLLKDTNEQLANAAAALKSCPNPKKSG